MVRLPNPINGRPAYAQGFGGDTSTAIIAAARQGGRTGYISAVGPDMFGLALRDLWSREGVDHGHVLTTDGCETGVCFIDPDPSGRKFTYARSGSAAARYDANDLPTEYIANARVLHVSGISMAISAAMRVATLRAIEIARENRILVSFDLNFRPALDVVFPSDDEARLLFGDERPEDVADRFLAAGAKIVVVKRGDRGAYLAAESERLHIAPAASSPVDASGAGDSFAGAFLAWFIETGDAKEAARRAAEVAAATVSGLGAVEPIPRRCL